ncbi:MAG TPA: Gfo/Idh/MocA family oxidoreductase, partial [Acidimicrobiales bacterium]
MVRIGFVGAGLIAWAHALSIKAMIDGGVLDAAITAVHDPRPRQAEGFVEAVGAPGAAAVSDATEVAARADAVFVCTPTSAHRGAVDAALAAGCAVFCEKPLDRDLARATALVDAVTA